MDINELTNELLKESRGDPYDNKTSNLTIQNLDQVSEINSDYKISEKSKALFSDPNVPLQNLFVDSLALKERLDSMKHCVIKPQDPIQPVLLNALQHEYLPEVRNLLLSKNHSVAVSPSRQSQKYKANLNESKKFFLYKQTGNKYFISYKMISVHTFIDDSKFRNTFLSTLFGFTIPNDKIFFEKFWIRWWRGPPPTFNNKIFSISDILKVELPSLFGVVQKYENYTLLPLLTDLRKGIDITVDKKYKPEVLFKVLLLYAKDVLGGLVSNEYYTYFHYFRSNNDIENMKIISLYFTLWLTPDRLRLLEEIVDIFESYIKFNNIDGMKLYLRHRSCIISYENKIEDLNTYIELISIIKERKYIKNSSFHRN